MRLSRVIPFAAVLTVVAIPASAGAATLSVDKPCYRGGQQALATGAGFTPNAQIEFTLDGQPFTNPDNPPVADATGSVSASFENGDPKLGTRAVPQKQYVLGASDGTNSAETTFVSTRLDVGVTPKRGNPGRRKRVRARGFDQGRILRFHVRGPRKRNGKVGRIKGACGKVNKRVRIFRATYPSGVYTVQFDQRRKYSPRANPRVVFQVTIFRVARSSLAAAAFSAHETWTPFD